MELLFKTGNSSFKTATVCVVRIKESKSRQILTWGHRCAKVRPYENVRGFGLRFNGIPEACTSAVSKSKQANFWFHFKKRNVSIIVIWFSQCRQDWYGAQVCALESLFCSREAQIISMENVLSWGDIVRKALLCCAHNWENELEEIRIFAYCISHHHILLSQMVLVSQLFLVLLRKIGA